MMNLDIFINVVDIIREFSPRILEASYAKIGEFVVKNANYFCGLDERVNVLLNVVKQVSTSY